MHFSACVNDLFQFRAVHTIHTISDSFSCSHNNYPVHCEYRALSSQQQCQYEISEIPRAKWNGTFRLHRPDPSHRAFGYCSYKQDAKERCWGQQFCQMERDISAVWPTETSEPVKVSHLQRRSQMFWLDRTEIVRSIWFLAEISGSLGRTKSTHGLNFMYRIIIAPKQMCTFIYAWHARTIECMEFW